MPSQLDCTANPQPKSPGPLSPVSHLWLLIQLSRGPSVSLLWPSRSSRGSHLLPGQEPSWLPPSHPHLGCQTERSPSPLHTLSSLSVLDQEWHNSTSRLGTQPLTKHLGQLEDTLQKLLRLQQQQKFLFICSPHLRRHLQGYPGVLLPILSLKCPGPWPGHHSSSETRGHRQAHAHKDCFTEANVVSCGGQDQP